MPDTEVPIGIKSAEQTPKEGKGMEEDGQKAKESSVNKLVQLGEAARKDATNIQIQLKGLREAAGNTLDPEVQEMDALSAKLYEATAGSALALGAQAEFADREPPEPFTETENPIQRAASAIQELQEKSKLRKSGEAFSVVGMVGGSDQIEGQQIDIVDQGEKTAVYFKTTSKMTEKIKNEIIPALFPDDVADGEYSFQFIDGESSTHSDAWVIKLDENTNIFVSKGGVKTTHEEYDLNKPIVDDKGEIVDYEMKTTVHQGHVRALEGAVKIEVRGLTDAQDIAEKVDSAFAKLKIADALAVPDQQAEVHYKEARYRWQHRIETERLWQELREKYKAEHGTELVDHLERQEVFPEYSTIVDKDASEQYIKDKEIMLIHTVHDPEAVVQMLKNGLLSTLERFKKGIPGTGQSTDHDFQEGGADSVFLRVFPEGGYDKSFQGRVHLLINPQVLDRTDWYAYNYDSYGTTEPSRFKLRPSPEQFFAEQGRHSSHTNEIMMRRGIPAEMVSGIIVGDKYSKERIIAVLQEAGMHEVNGVRIDHLIRIPPELEGLNKQNSTHTPESNSSTKKNRNNKAEKQPVKSSDQLASLYEDDEGD